MPKNYIQEGEVLDWTNAGTAVASGDVVVIGSNGDALIGVALVDIAQYAQGSVAIEGVWEVPKVSAAVIAQGEYVIWDVSAKAFDDNAATPAAGDVVDGAIAWEAAGDGDTSIKVLLIAKPGTLTAGT